MRPDCKADVAFLLDSSESMKADYTRQKDFLNVLASLFGKGGANSRMGVITFSFESKLSIKFEVGTRVSLVEFLIQNVS